MMKDFVGNLYDYNQCAQIANNDEIDQKQPPGGVPRERCSENMQQIYRRTPMPKYDFNKVAL